MLAMVARAGVHSVKIGRHAPVGLLRQSVFSRFAGKEDLNDAQRLGHWPLDYAQTLSALFGI
jgi:hypothetical protein